MEKMECDICHLNNVNKVFTLRKCHFTKEGRKLLHNTNKVHSVCFTCGKTLVILGLYRVKDFWKNVFLKWGVRY